MQSIQNYEALGTEDKVKFFPGFYLKLESFLCEDDPSFNSSRTEFRAEFANTCPELVALRSIALIFEPSPKGEQILIAGYLSDVLSELKDRLGSKLPFIERNEKHLNRLWKEGVSLYDNELVDLSTPQFEHLRHLIQFFRKKMIDMKGQTADELIRSLLKEYAEKYGSFVGASSG